MVVVSPFFIARCQAPKLLESVDQAFDPVTLTVDRSIKGAGAPFVGLPRDRDADAPSAQIRPDLPAAIALVADDALRSQLRATSPRPLDRPVFQQGLKRRRFMPLARGQDDRDGLAVAVGAEMDFGAEATLAPAQRFGCRVPVFAPAACWWARMTVAST
jgi:hypothetical protein